MPAAPRPPLLLTRPRPDAQRFARMQPDWPMVISPVLRIVPVAHDKARLAQAEGMVFTSAHAVASAGPGRGRPAICVGQHTADIARQAGFAVTTGSGFAESLPPMIAASEVPLIHPHGRHLARRLPVPGMVVYDQDPQPLDDAARALLAGTAPVILPLFSPRSARLLSAQIVQMGSELCAPLWVVGISEATRAAFDVHADRVAIAPQPEAEAMWQAIRAIAAPKRS